MSEVLPVTSPALAARYRARFLEFPFPHVAEVAGRLPQGPSGIGTSAAHLARTLGRCGATPVRDELHCPPALRRDPVLERAVNDGLVEWAGQVGIFPGRLDVLREMNFGRLITLTYVDTDDYDRLLAVARMTLAWWTADDYYCDDASLGSVPALLGSRLAVAYTATDPVAMPDRYAADLDAAVDREPVLAAHRCAWRRLSRYTTPVQAERIRHEAATLFLGYEQEASWRHEDRLPSVWEYLLNRAVNSFRPNLAMIDAVAGYEVPGPEFADPRVRRVMNLAGTASVLVNDLYSMDKERSSPGLDFDLPAVIAAEEGCTHDEAVQRSIRIHNDLVHDYERESASLALTGSPALGRFLAGMWAWLGGNREWHATTARYGNQRSAG
ncbi:family 2 encapsulin nanocompartment cargo protein terpene cyclase [Nocardia sp. NRRL S-836]|uniref:family 2 encapsulin nanocompartment cargo protein terpene cyclase n=1 Tax=Nocardia sp. NRRL S-836 TaxID=1519492 RepID=UPI0009E8EC45|nr:family 2 encapsulin nanocompartment cargo protein terpene cyclase [Nocardia sp. NRRL S-836]